MKKLFITFLFCLGSLFWVSQSAEIPKHLYIIGTVDNEAGEKYDLIGVEMTNNEGEFFANDVTLHYEDGKEVLFYISTKNGSEWQEGVTYAVETDMSSAHFTTLNLWDFSNTAILKCGIKPSYNKSIGMKLKPAGTYDFALDFNEAEPVLTISKVPELPTSVESVVAEDGEGEAVYYNLQGCVVDNPKAGVYVKRTQSGKAALVHVR